jgi:hypothetical protein
MTESEALLIRNLLNGVPVAAAAQASQMTEGEAGQAFAEAMKRVAEYQLVHCVPYTPVGALSEARRNRVRVLEMLGEIQRWDDEERGIVLAILEGRNVIADGLPREDAERAMKRAIDAMPHYLQTPADLRAWGKDRAKFVRENRARVREIVEGFVSFRQPLIYKKIEHATGGFDLLQANLSQLR